MNPTTTVACRKCGEEVVREQRGGRVYRTNAFGGRLPGGKSHAQYCRALRMAALIPSSSGGGVDEARVRALVQQAMAEGGRSNLVVSVRGSDAKPVEVGRQHKRFETLLAVVARRHSVWMAGPAGSGKTTAAAAVAKALGLEYGSISVGPQTTQAALFGSRFAQGDYIDTEFRRRFQNGGVFLLDEIDRGNPGVLTSLNQALENGVCAFPDGMVPRHKDFVAIAAANTWGTGASREYVGALQLDAATLNRFVMLEWDYDTALERDIAVAAYRGAGGDEDAVADAWVERVQRVRARVSELGIRHIVSPRASIVGADLLGSGMAQELVETLVLWKGLDAESVRRVQ